MHSFRSAPTGNYDGEVVRARGSGLVIWGYAALFLEQGELLVLRDGVPE